ncbi:hypothetical protein KVP09_13155 [Alcaligenaceae bacterium CGII-47]|nr:hypothetical protein [Alcaligenaceae bacterium CGII-47]
MKSIAGILMATLALSWPVAGIAADAVIGLSPSGSEHITAYAEPNAKSATEQMPVSTLIFPLPILQTKSGFLAVQLNGQSYWLRAAKVRVKRDSSAKCSELIASATPTNATPGVGGTGCR